MNNKKLDCDIVRDLLPLYHDGVVSENSSLAIKQHLENCTECQKEYEVLCADIPVEAEVFTTKKQFSNMMKKSKRKRFFISVVAVIIICAIVIGGYFLQLQIPVVNIPKDDITVHSAYKYETEEGYKLFVLYSYSDLGHTVGDISLKENENTLVMNIKKPFLSQKFEGVNTRDEVWRYEYGYGSGDNGEIEYVDFDKVEFAGNTIWDINENANEVIPEYVYAYEDFEEMNGEVVSWVTDLEKGYVGAGYKDGRFIAWDLDGNVLYEK